VGASVRFSASADNVSACCRSGGVYALRDESSAWEYVFIVASSGCLLYQAYRMYPYTRLARRQVQPSRSVDPSAACSLLFANVLMTNRNSAGLLRLIKRYDPDVILTVECDSWWERQLAGIARSHPYTVLQPQDNTYGMLLYSRLNFRNAKVQFLVQDDVPSIHGSDHFPVYIKHRRLNVTPAE
jgi:endonuclease/exonuclease/phosphatase (EEP) superfamily protein YafD